MLQAIKVLEQQSQQEITPKTTGSDLPLVTQDFSEVYEKARIEAFIEGKLKTEPGSHHKRDPNAAPKKRGWPAGVPRGPRKPREPKPAPVVASAPIDPPTLEGDLSEQIESRLGDPPSPIKFGGRPPGATYRNPEFVEKKAEGLDREYVRKYTRSRLPDILKQMHEMIEDPETARNTKARLIEVWLEYAVDKPRIADADDEGQQAVLINVLPDAS